jgi:hypothetical protein
VLSLIFDRFLNIVTGRPRDKMGTTNGQKTIKGVRISIGRFKSIKPLMNPNSLKHRSRWYILRCHRSNTGSRRPRVQAVVCRSSKLSRCANGSHSTGFTSRSRERDTDWREIRCICCWYVPTTLTFGEHRILTVYKNHAVSEQQLPQMPF